MSVRYFADHICWSEKPGVQRWGWHNIGGASYKYEGLPFYVFAKTSNDQGDDNADLALYKKYDASKVDNYLYTLKSGEKDSYPGTAKHFNGYIYSTWRAGLVPLREYYSEKQKDHFILLLKANLRQWDMNLGDISLLKY